jgi:PleD family two-component response regulator
VIGERVRQVVSGTTGDGSDSLIQIPLKISMGVADLRPHGTLDALIRDADKALNRAKNAGRDTISQ